MSNNEGNIRPSLSVSLCLCVHIFFLLFPEIPKAQPHNGQVYQQLLSDYLTQHLQPFQSVDGPNFPPYTPKIPIDSSASTRLTLGFPEIVYSKLEDGRTVRSVSVSLQLEDSSLQSQALQYQDTLEEKMLRNVYAESPKSLRGENPTAQARWGLPILLVGGSVGGVVSLFYFRSRRSQ